MIFPWPQDQLFVNKSSGKSWKTTRKHKDTYKVACMLIAKRMKLQPKEDMGLHIVFTPPERKGRAPDLDNCLAAFKHGLDGIFKAMNVDDSVINHMIIERMPKQGIGFIEIKII